MMKNRITITIKLEKVRCCNTTETELTREASQNSKIKRKAKRLCCCLALIENDEDIDGETEVNASK